MKVLITGSSGFIGKALISSLEGERISFKGPCSSVLNVTRKEDFDQFIDEEFTHVVHLAGKSYVPESWQKPVDFFEHKVT